MGLAIPSRREVSNFLFHPTTALSWAGTIGVGVLFFGLAHGIVAVANRWDKSNVTHVKPENYNKNATMKKTGSLSGYMSVPAQTDFKVFKGHIIKKQ